MLVSIVVPLFNEAPSLESLHRELSQTLASLPHDFEILFVDDGSTDASWRNVQEIVKSDDRVRGVRLRRNFGKSEALEVGFRESRGDVIVTLDADLQDDPGEIPRFLEALNREADVVNGWKKNRRDVWHRRWASRLFNLLVNWSTGVKLHDHNCGMKCFRSEVLREVHVYGDLHRFLPVLAAARGFRIKEMEVHHRPRRFGRSRYGWERIPRGLLDILTISSLTTYRGRPQHLLGFAGLGLFLLGLLGTVWLTLAWFLSRNLAGWEPVHLHERALFYYSLAGLLLGTQLLSLGFLAELIHWRFQSTRTSYSIAEHARHDG